MLRIGELLVVSKLAPGTLQVGLQNRFISAWGGATVLVWCYAINTTFNWFSRAVPNDLSNNDTELYSYRAGATGSWDSCVYFWAAFTGFWDWITYDPKVIVSTNIKGKLNVSCLAPWVRLWWWKGVINYLLLINFYNNVLAVLRINARHCELKANSALKECFKMEQEQLHHDLKSVRGTRHRQPKLIEKKTDIVCK